jgi:hypothetical protein
MIPHYIMIPANCTEVSQNAFLPLTIKPTIPKWISAYIIQFKKYDM